MKNQIEYFKVEEELGWNQNRFRDWIMYLGGCAAVTACDLNINLAQKTGKKELYPYDIDKIDRKDYLKFSKIMKPYLKPRMNGIDSLPLYIDGLSTYWRDAGVDFCKIEGLSGNALFEDARKLVVEQIDSGIIVPCLLLHHKQKEFSDFEWHWFNIAGYEEINGEFYVSVVTYGHKYNLNFRQLWDTGYDKKGGLIRVLPYDDFSAVS